MPEPPDDHRSTRADEAAELVAEMRASVEAAARQLDELSSELHERRALVDDLECVVDLLLELGDALVVVVDEARRIVGVSRAAAERFEGAAVGKPLSSVLPEVAADEVMDSLAGGDGGAIELWTGDGARVHPLPGGGAMLVLPNP